MIEGTGLRSAKPGVSLVGANALLTVTDVKRHFGALRAVDGLSFEVHEGEILSIIGPNGAGKTTLFNLFTGVYPATGGKTVFRGRSILGLPEHLITELGIARTYQIVRVFGGMTVLENVQVGLYCRTTSGVWDALLRTTRARQEEKWSRARSMELLDFVGIARYAEELARNLPLGCRKRLEVARALASKPALLLLDEPTGGMNPSEKHDMMSLIRTVRESGITVILVEHDMRVVMGISDRVIVLNHGVKIAEGAPLEVQLDAGVIEAYLGRGLDEPADG